MLPGSAGRELWRSQPSVRHRSARSSRSIEPSASRISRGVSWSGSSTSTETRKAPRRSPSVKAARSSPGKNQSARPPQNPGCSSSPATARSSTSEAGISRTPSMPASFSLRAARSASSRVSNIAVNVPHPVLLRMRGHLCRRRWLLLLLDLASGQRLPMFQAARSGETQPTSFVGACAHFTKIDRRGNR